MADSRIAPLLFIRREPVLFMLTGSDYYYIQPNVQDTTVSIGTCHLIRRKHET